MSYRDYYQSGEPTHQYYTLSLVNPPRDDLTDEFPIVYNEMRNSPFLKDPQSYYASVVRFSCTTPLLPILIPALKNPATGQTHYSVTMHHPGFNSGVPVRTYVTFSSVNPFVDRASQEYNYIYQPIQFINMVNQALAFCWEALTTTIPNDPPFIAWNNDTSVGSFYVPSDFCRTPYPQSNIGFPTGYPPAGGASSIVSGFASGPSVGANFENYTVQLAPGQSARYLVGDYVNTSGLGSNSQPAPAAPVRIVAIAGDSLILGSRGPFTPYTAGGSGAGATVLANTPIGIYFNAALYNLFSSFSAENQSSVTTPNPPNGTHWKIMFAPTYGSIISGVYPSAGLAAGEISYPNYGDLTASPTTGLLRLAITQQYSTLPVWNPVSSFVFLTSVLPINPENISIPAIANSINNGGNNSAIGTVLTDFEIPLEKGWENKPTINYTPSAEYRLVDLNGNAPLSTIQISIGWRDRSGTFRALNIGPNGFAQIKMLFRKKDFDGA